MKEIKIYVKGMVCGGCENRVQNAVNTIKGVKTVTANHEDGTVIIMCKEKVDKKEIMEKIESIGFEVIKEIEE